MHPASLALLELTSVRALAGTHGDAGDASVPRAPMNTRTVPYIPCQQSLDLCLPGPTPEVNVSSCQWTSFVLDPRPVANWPGRLLGCVWRPWSTGQGAMSAISCLLGSRNAQDKLRALYPAREGNGGESAAAHAGSGPSFRLPTIDAAFESSTPGSGLSSKPHPMTTRTPTTSSILHSLNCRPSPMLTSR